MISLIIVMMFYGLYFMILCASVYSGRFNQLDNFICIQMARTLLLQSLVNNVCCAVIMIFWKVRDCQIVRESLHIEIEKFMELKCHSNFKVKILTWSKKCYF